MSLIEISIMSLLELFGYLIVSSKLTSSTPHLYIKNRILTLFSVSIFLSFIMGYLDTLVIGNYGFIYGALVSILFIYFLYRGNFKETIFLYIISTIVLLIIQILIISILQLVGVHKILDFKMGLIAQIFIILILFLINRFTQLNLIFKYVYTKNKLFYGLVLNMFVILTSFLTYRYMEMEGLLKDILVVAILSIGMLYVNFVLIKNGLKNEYEEKMLLTYEKYLFVIDDLMEKIRAKQHEFDNHVQALHMLTFSCTDYDSLVSSMNKYIDDLESDTDLRDLIKLDNKILAGFLYESLKKAKVNNIDYKIKIDDYGFKTNLKDYELIEVIGNLIDNAFETKVDTNIVRLSFKKEEDMNVIEIKNKHPYLNSDSLTKFFIPGFSTKMFASHGYGLPNIKNIIDKHNGIINLENECIDGENYIVFRILLL